MGLVGLLFLLGAYTLVDAAHPIAAGVFVWVAISFCVVSAAYVLRAPAWFGKRRDGGLSIVPFVLWMPFLLITRAIHEVQRLVTREPAHDVVADRILVGRRPKLHEIPDDVQLVIDLCAELPASRGVVAHRRYLALPTLDASAPSIEAFREGVEAILACDGPVLVHCAFGHGRSAAVATAAVMRREGISSIEIAEASLHARRPGIQLNRDQREAIARYLASIAS
jgi:hypothetical protein